VTPMTIERIDAGDFPGDYLPAPLCPVCGEECAVVILNWRGQVVGCESYTSREDAFDRLYA